MRSLQHHIISVAANIWQLAAARRGGVVNNAMRLNISGRSARRQQRHLAAFNERRRGDMKAVANERRQWRNLIYNGGVNKRIVNDAGVSCKQPWRSLSAAWQLIMAISISLIGEHSMANKEQMT